MDSEYLTDGVDPVSPVSLRRSVDELRDAGALQERYNHLAYEFERDGVAVVARAYLDEIDRVNSVEPSSAHDPAVVVRAPELKAVLAYSKRRHRSIVKLAPDRGLHEVRRRDPA